MNYRLTLLEWMEIVGDDGRHVDHLMDLRARADRGPIDRAADLEPDVMLVGAVGWLETMGLRRSGAREIPLNWIVAIESEKVRVRRSAALTRAKGKGRKKR
jgi:hypothetical protein